jgi:hypothetical protein
MVRKHTAALQPLQNAKFDVLWELEHDEGNTMLLLCVRSHTFMLYNAQVDITCAESELTRTEHYSSLGIICCQNPWSP